MRRLFAALSLSILAHAQNQWPTYGGDPGGQRYTAATEINRTNVTQLRLAWTFHTGYIAKNLPGTSGSSLETTPVLFHGELLLTTPFDEVFALDPATGNERWHYEPVLGDISSAGILTSRGVAVWPQPENDNTLVAQSPCSIRVFVATMDARLIAVDALNGQLCDSFGSHGVVSLTGNVGYKPGDPYFITSPPTVVGDAVVVGSGIGDNRRVDIESGLVRAFDARTGKQLWQWEPLPWAAAQHTRTGAGNAWSIIAADPEHHLVFIPTGAPSPDYYGGLRPGDNRDANSVVALNSDTGARVWGFQVVHHDIWDYDVAAEPLLFAWHGPDGKQNVPAIAVSTKQGMVFLLNRLTGQPLFPVDERSTPKSDIAAELTSPTQPFPRIGALAPLTVDFTHARLGITDADNTECHALLAPLRYDGIYTPPSLGGTIEYPGNLGGVNWGSTSIDPATGTLYANTNRYAFLIQLIPHPSRARASITWVFDHSKALLLVACSLAMLALVLSALLRRSHKPGTFASALSAAVVLSAIGYIAHDALGRHATANHPNEHFGAELSAQDETPYSIRREPLRTKAGVPCTPQPFGALSALDINTGKLRFSMPVGTMTPAAHTGTVTVGGPLTTAGGLVFTAASRDPHIHAFDSSTGTELWTGALPNPGQATPMSYTWQGRQYIVTAAGGHGGFGTDIGDSIVAFALPATQK